MSIFLAAEGMNYNSIVSTPIPKHPTQNDIQWSSKSEPSIPSPVLSLSIYSSSYPLRLAISSSFSTPRFPKNPSRTSLSRLSKEVPDSTSMCHFRTIGNCVYFAWYWYGFDLTKVCAGYAYCHVHICAIVVPLGEKRGVICGDHSVEIAQRKREVGSAKS